MRIQVCNKEAAAYILLRKKGYPISLIAKAFGRSTSVVWRRLRFARALGTIQWRDYRRLPDSLRKMARAIRERMLRKYIEKWESWILSEEGEPP